MYEGVHAAPDGDSTVARMAMTASEYGYEGIVVRNHGGEPASYDPETIRETYDVDVVTGVEIRASDPSRASGFLGSHRDQRTIVAVHGGDPAMNRFAVEQPAVDVLAHPMTGEGDFNHVLAREAAENGVRVEVSLGPILRNGGGERTQAIQSLQKLTDLLTYYETPFVMSGDPASHLQLRAPRELQSLADLIGMCGEEVADGLREWGRLATRNRERHSPEFVQSGIRREPTESDDK
jgi:ribonuclease P/MRP protein subunit RPP1